MLRFRSVAWKLPREAEFVPHVDNKNVTLALVIAWLGILLCDSAVARDRTWYRYENSNFEAFNDESEKVTGKLLIELENFRAAVLQIANIETPEDAQKTKVIIFESKKQFNKLIGSTRISGVAFMAFNIAVGDVLQGNGRFPTT